MKYPGYVKNILAIVFSLVGSVSQAQNEPVFFFEQFLHAKIHFKNRSVTIVPMNYDAANDKMYFKRDGQLMELVNLTTVDSVVWGKKVCFPYTNHGFLEKVKLTHGTVFIQWRVKNVNVGYRGALGSITQAKVDRVYSSGSGGSQHADVYQLKNNNNYYIMPEDSFKEVTTLKQLLKQFPHHTTAIETFVKEHNIQMQQPHSMLELLDYCLSLQP